MLGLLLLISVSAMGITINFDANFGDWWRPAESSGTESRSEQSRAENRFPLHPGDVISFREERFLVRNCRGSSNFRACVCPYFNAKCNMPVFEKESPVG